MDGIAPTDVRIDISDRARQAGFPGPVAITSQLMADLADIPSHLTHVCSVDSRLWDLLWVAHCAIRLEQGDRTQIAYRLHLPRTASPKEHSYLVTMVVGAGDATDPATTFFAPTDGLPNGGPVCATQ